MSFKLVTFVWSRPFTWGTLPPLLRDVVRNRDVVSVPIAESPQPCLTRRTSRRTGKLSRASIRTPRARRSWKVGQRSSVGDTHRIAGCTPLRTSLLLYLQDRTSIVLPRDLFRVLSILLVEKPDNCRRPLDLQNGKTHSTRLAETVHGACLIFADRPSLWLLLTLWSRYGSPDYPRKHLHRARRIFATSGGRGRKPLPFLSLFPGASRSPLEVPSRSISRRG